MVTCTTLRYTVQGKGSTNEFSAEFGLSVVLGLLQSLPPGNFALYIDNYFVSIPLMKHLAEMYIGCTGTVKQNMLQDCPAPEKSVLKKKNKGYFKGFQDNNSNVKVCMWNDNGPVTVATNFEDIFPMDSARRWDQKNKKICECG